MQPEIRSLFGEQPREHRDACGHAGAGTPCGGDRSCPRLRHGAPPAPPRDLDPELARGAFFDEPAQGLTVSWILDTHLHHGPMTGARPARKGAGGQTGIGAGTMVAGLPLTDFIAPGLIMFKPDGSQFDHLFQRRRALSDPATARGRAGDRRRRAIRPRRHLRGGRRGLRRGYAFHARRRHGALRFSGRRCAAALRSIDRIPALPGTCAFFVCHDYHARRPVRRSAGKTSGHDAASPETSISPA